MEMWQGPRPGRWGDGFRAGRLARCGDRHPGGANRRGREVWHPSLSLWPGLATGLPTQRPETSATNKVTLSRDLPSSISGGWGGRLWPVARSVIGPPRPLPGRCPPREAFSRQFGLQVRAGSRQVACRLLSWTSKPKSPTETPSFSCSRPSDAQGSRGRGRSDKGKEGKGKT